MALLAVLAAAPACPGTGRKKMPVWVEAGEAHTTAMKVYNLGDWAQAAKALEDFVKRFSTHENVPLAYLQLAHCTSLLKDAEGSEAALDEVIKRFGDSRASQYAWAEKLYRTRTRKDYDGYLKLFKAMAGKTGPAPLSMRRRLDWRRHTDYYAYYRLYTHWPSRYRSGYRLRVAPPWGWVRSLVEVADSQPRAQQVLDIYKGVLKARGHDLPVDWKFAHVVLLRRAGKAEEAEAQFQIYLKGWPKGDPRVMGLWLLAAEHAQARKDDKKADEIYQRLIATWPAYASLGARLPTRLAYLYSRRRYDEYIKLARWFLHTYPASGWRDRAITYWIAIAKKNAAKKDPSQAAAVLKLLDGEDKTYPHDPQRLRANLIRRIDLLLVLKKVDEAVPLAEQLVGEKHWSAESYKQVQAYARKHKAFQPVVGSARAKWVIPVADPKPQAAALLKDLRVRIKDNQTRHMEEIGDELVAKHPKAASTIAACRALMAYYLKRALHEKRNKWADRMIRSYPCHPATQQVLTEQIQAEHAEKSYKRLAPLLERAMARFPGARLWATWFGYRVVCYGALKDTKGKLAFVRRHLAKRADAGELRAVGQLGTYEEQALASPQERAEYWMTQAEKFAGTDRALYCYRRALSAAYLTPRSRSLWRDVDFASAVEAAEALRTQDRDPELRWRMAFEDVNLHSQSNAGTEALGALEGRLKGLTQPVHLSHRLDLPNLGRAIGSALVMARLTSKAEGRKLSARAKAVVAQLKTLCTGRTDTLAFHLMLAVMYEQEKRYAYAARSYLTAARLFPRPIDQYGLQAKAMACLRAAKAPQYSSLQMAYIRRIPTAQDVVPSLLLQVGNHHWRRNKAAAKSYYRQIAQRYPASSAMKQVAKLAAKKPRE